MDRKDKKPSLTTKRIKEPIDNLGSRASIKERDHTYLVPSSRLPGKDAANSKKPAKIRETETKGMVEQLIEEKLDKKFKGLKDYFEKKIAEMEKKRILEKDKIEEEKDELFRENKKLSKALKDYQSEMSKTVRNRELSQNSHENADQLDKKTEKISKLIKENETMKDIIQSMKEDKRDLLERCNQRSIESVRLTDECEVLKTELKDKNTLLEGRSKQFEARFKEVQERLIRQEDQWKLQWASLQRDHSKLESLVDKLYRAFVNSDRSAISHNHSDSPPSSNRSNNVTQSQSRFSKAKTK